MSTLAKRVQILHLKARIIVLLRLTKWHETFHLMYMKHLCITVGLEIAKIKRILAETFVGGLICVAPNLLTPKAERSNYTHVFREFCVPKNSFQLLPTVLKAYFERLEIAF